MPEFKTHLFGNLPVIIELNQNGEFIDCFDLAGNQIDLTEVYKKNGEKYTLIIDAIADEIDDFMAEWHTEMEEFRKAGGRDRMGE